MERILSEKEYQELIKKVESNVIFYQYFYHDTDFNFTNISYKNFTNQQIIDKIEEYNNNLKEHHKNLPHLIQIEKDYLKIPKWIRNIWK